MVDKKSSYSSSTRDITPAESSNYKKIDPISSIQKVTTILEIYRKFILGDKGKQNDQRGRLAALAGERPADPLPEPKITTETLFWPNRVCARNIKQVGRLERSFFLNGQVWGVPVEGTTYRVPESN